ncbi:MAG: DJ-1/PfpI family protein [Clostridiales bacterium]|jgi:4-methyl-5(b-hydroxyethyl)-thiazole monophosphate biosynthesis|nr:DJ-1/PfpI family protein [Clostridiales bacterium]MDR2749848.1 DJ-1/PfpI family protein [Clostridiales bacterium]
MKAAVFLTEGFEETEAITTIDILRRGEVEVETVSLSGKKSATGAHGIPVEADTVFSGDVSSYGILVLPGGGGYVHYLENKDFTEALTSHFKAGKPVAAICAAPTVLGALGLLGGKTAVCYPGMEDDLGDAKRGDSAVAVDGELITSRGPATAVKFGLAIVEKLKGKEAADKVADAFLAKLA